MAESATSGGVAAFRAGVTSKFPHIDQHVDQQSPHFDGTAAEFVAAHGGDTVVAEQLKNTVKKCPACGKANACVRARVRALCVRVSVHGRMRPRLSPRRVSPRLVRSTVSVQRWVELAWVQVPSSHLQRLQW